MSIQPGSAAPNYALATQNFNRVQEALGKQMDYITQQSQDHGYSIPNWGDYQSYFSALNQAAQATGIPGRLNTVM